MLVYPHPLDYVAGIKYTLTDYKVNRTYTPTPDTFHVEEIVDFEKLGYNTEKGEYAVIRLEKKNLETLKALIILARALDIPVENLYILGLKDKHAYTVSYVFIRKTLLDYSKLPVVKSNLKAEFTGYVRVKPSIKHHIGNKFTIIVDNVEEIHVEGFKNIVKQVEVFGLPSYYGYQRFGFHRCNSHLLGKYFLLQREDLFADELLARLHLYEDLAVVIKRLLRNYKGLHYESIYLKNTSMGYYSERYYSLLQNAYLSYLFNLLLNTIIEKFGWNSLDQEYPSPGCLNNAIKLYNDIFEREFVKLAELKPTRCYYRRGLFRPLNNNIEFSNSVLRYEFLLERGMYATIVLREIFKDNLVLN